MIIKLSARRHSYYQIGGENDNNAIPFEFEIPQGVNQSYIRKYSEYFWGLEANVNIAW
jgi:hypothetical protein